MHANMLVLPGLGIPAGYYTPLVDALRAAGANATTLELPGQGDREPPSRHNDPGFADLLDHDLPAAIADLRASDEADAPTILLGHSIGGHLAAMHAGRPGSDVDGLVLAACGSPYHHAYDMAMAAKIRVLTAMIPVSGAVLGHFPGDRLDFGGRQPRSLMLDWRHLALTNTYVARGIDEDLDGQVGQWSGPVLAVRMADDDFAPEAAVHAVTDKFSTAEVTHRVLSADELGTRANHHGWARHPDAIVATIRTWLGRR